MIGFTPLIRASRGRLRRGGACAGWLAVSGLRPGRAERRWSEQRLQKNTSKFEDTSSADEAEFFSL